MPVAIDTSADGAGTEFRTENGDQVMDPGFIYFLDFSDREQYIYVGWTDNLHKRLRTHRGQHHSLLAVMKGSEDFEKRIHDALRGAGLAATTVKNKSTYQGEHIWKYVEFLVKKGVAALAEKDAPHMPCVPWDTIDPLGQWYAAQEQIDLFALGPRARIERAARVAYHLSGSDEWYTPAHIIEAARATLGTIDLDPASSPVANRTVDATHYYSKECSGLAHPWHGNIWLNPPYAELGQRFVEHLLGELRARRIAQAVVLLNQNSMSSEWFVPIYEHALALLVTRGRLRFTAGSEDQKFSSPSTGSVICYFSANPPGAFGRFIECFSPYGHVLMPYLVRREEAAAE